MWCSSCCISNCSSKRKDFKLHKFPSDDHRRNKWLHFINCSGLNSLDVEDLMKLQICHKHFEERFHSENGLKKTAFPTLFSAEEIEHPVAHTTLTKFLQLLNTHMHVKGMSMRTTHIACHRKDRSWIFYKKNGIYLQWWRWFVYTNDVKQLWEAQPTFLISQAIYIFAGLVTLIHAFRKGGRWPYFWLGSLLHGLYADNFWHFILPEYDNFWHSQSPVMFLGGRLPLHIIILYPVFMYNAAYAVSKLKLPKYAEPFAVGLVTVLIDIPYDIVAVKFVHWTWHDTDPNIFDRHYWVPWNSYYFHATFAASFFFFFQFSGQWLAPKVAKWESAGKKAEWKSLLIAVVLGMPGGVLMFVPIYHPLHDIFQIHSEVTFFMLFSVFAAITLNGLLSDREKVKERLTTIDYVLILQLVIHYITYLAFVIYFKPENEWSLGLHEPIGPCNEMATLTTPFGQTLQKRKYLCLEDYDEGYFDFHCIGNQRPVNYSNYYVICGTPFQNRAEYIAIISIINVLAAGIFYALFFKTTPALTAQSKKLKSK